MKKEFISSIQESDFGLGLSRIQGSHEGGGLRVALVASRFNPAFTDALIQTALEGLEACGVERSDLLLVRVPGAYEIPPVIEQLAQHGTCDALIALGTVIEGETPHATLINQCIASSLSRTSCEHAVPVIDCVVAVHNEEQAAARCLSGRESRGWYAALAAVETAHVHRALKGLR